MKWFSYPIAFYDINNKVLVEMYMYIYGVCARACVCVRVHAYMSKKGIKYAYQWEDHLNSKARGFATWQKGLL